jgi:hypothetical protein
MRRNSTIAAYLLAGQQSIGWFNPGKVMEKLPARSAALDR